MNLVQARTELYHDHDVINTGVSVAGDKTMPRHFEINIIGNDNNNMVRIRRPSHGSRIRNLQGCLALVSVVLFTGILLAHQHSNPPDYPIRLRLPSHRTTNRLQKPSAWIYEDAPYFNKNNVASQARHLIIVAGHSVLLSTSDHVEDASRDEQDWYLLSYQKGKGLPQAILGHIRKGIQLAQQDDAGLLVFSGGETRAQTGPEAEGASYFRVADALQLWGPASTVRSRTTTEEYATDSFQNLFREVTGRYPEKIAVVSFTFKETRFATMHANALRWPSESFLYYGVDPDTQTTSFDLEEARSGEHTNAVEPFSRDPYGCHTPVLQRKRIERNPFSRTPPYELSCPEIKSLLRYCGPGLIRSDLVPWGVQGRR